MNKNASILIVGHDDIIEKSLYHHLFSTGYLNVHSSSQLGMNPTIQPSVYEFFQDKKPEYVFLGSTRSGGIEANQKNPAEFLYHNLESQNNIFYAAQKFGVKKLLYLGSSCVYPKECPQPIKEEYLLTGEVEKTSEAYAIAKIAGIKLCQFYRQQYGFNAITMVPATVYGPQSDTDSQTAHVIGALLGKFTKAVKERSEEVQVWGTGTPRREFLFVDDFLEASLLLMARYDEGGLINVGCGSDVTIKELAGLIADTVGFKEKISFNASKPDGVAQKLLDNSRMKKLGWKAKVELKEGIEKTYQSFKEK